MTPDIYHSLFSLSNIMILSEIKHFLTINMNRKKEQNKAKMELNI